MKITALETRIAKFLVGLEETFLSGAGRGLRS